MTTEATVRGDQRARGVIVAKSRCVIAGVDVAAEAFRQLDPAVTFSARRSDGQWCSPGDVVAEVHGAAAAMLTAERTALNLMQRMSGIATLTRSFVDAAARPHHDPRHAQNHADPEGAREVRGAGRRRVEPSIAGWTMGS